LKAVNQPFNQLVVPEFDRDEYAASIEALKKNDPNAPTMDKALLAVVGILEALRTVDNVPAWIRAGGLMARDGPRVQADAPTRPVKLKDLPSYAAFAHWYADAEIMARWVAQGVKALEDRGIMVDPGLDATGRRQGAMEL
jgi:hypothetical protein